MSLLLAWVQDKNKGCCQRVCNHGSWMHATFSVWFSTAKGAVVSQATVSPLTWWAARQENARQGSRSHFPILVKLFALWWQMLVQTSDITVRSQIAKVCAHCRRPDCGCLFRSYAVYLRYSKLFLPLCSLADTDTAPFNFSRTTAADPGLMLQTPSPLLLSNKRSP